MELDKIAKEKEDVKRMLQFFLKLMTADTIVRTLQMKMTERINDKILARRKVMAAKKMARKLRIFIKRRHPDPKVRIRATFRK